MKIAAVADCHLGLMRTFGGPTKSGLNERTHHTLNVLGAAVDLAVEQGADAFLIAGDLFDVDAPNPQLIAATVSVLADRVMSYALVGNHDQRSADTGDHALAPLSALGCTAVIDAPSVYRLGPGLRLWAIPFHRDHAKEYIPRAMTACAARTPPGERALLMFHAGIADAGTPDYLRGAHDAIHTTDLEAALKAHPAVEFVVCGNWHTRGNWTLAGVPVWQCGALTPTGFGNPGGDGKYGGVVLWDSETRRTEVYEIPGPRFFLLPSPPDFTEVRASITASPPYVCVKGVTPQNVKDVERAILESGLKLGGARLDPARAQDAVVVAATSARSAPTLAAAVQRYTEKMSLPAGVTRGEVRAVVSRLLPEAP